jgi:hypothetical protein
MEHIIFHLKNFFISFCYINRKKFGSVFINQRFFNSKKNTKKEKNFFSLRSLD